MASGFFLGGLAQGFQNQSQITNTQAYQQGLLQIEQKRLQQQQENEQRNYYMKLRSDWIDRMTHTAEVLKNSNPNLTDMQLAAHPAIVSQKKFLQQYDQNLHIPDESDSVVAGIVAGMSQIQTAKAEAEATGQLQLRQAQAAKESAQAQELKAEAQTFAGTGGDNDKIKDFLAGELLSGNQQALSGMGFSKLAGQFKIDVYRRAAQMAMDSGMKPEDVNANIAEFMGQKRGASALGQREAQVIGAATTAQNTAPRVLETSANVDRTQYPTINSVLLAVKKGTGDENVIRFGIAVNTFVNNYARALGAGNARVTDSARKEAMDLLETNYSKGQIAAAVDQMLNKELPSEITGAKMGIKEFLNKNQNPSAQGITVHGFTFTPGQ